MKALFSPLKLPIQEATIKLLQKFGNQHSAAAIVVQWYRHEGHVPHPRPFFKAIVTSLFLTIGAHLPDFY